MLHTGAATAAAAADDDDDDDDDDDASVMMKAVKSVIDVAGRLSRGWPNTELPVLRLVTFAVVNWNDKDERFVSLPSCQSHG